MEILCDDLVRKLGQVLDLVRRECLGIVLLGAGNRLRNVPILKRSLLFGFFGFLFRRFARSSDLCSKTHFYLKSNYSRLQ